MRIVTATVGAASMTAVLATALALPAAAAAPASVPAAHVLIVAAPVSALHRFVVADKHCTVPDTVYCHT
jgi:hypothetical protein